MWRVTQGDYCKWLGNFSKFVEIIMHTWLNSGEFWRSSINPENFFKYAEFRVNSLVVVMTLKIGNMKYRNANEILFIHSKKHYNLIIIIFVDRK
jgi:hypothetical protein